jgi:phage baseplate assembly protein W
MQKYEHGIAFPIELTPEGAPVYSGIEDSVNASILEILSWPLNRRPYDLNFGSVAVFLWAPGVPENHMLIATLIKNSILRNDFRVSQVKVNIYAEGSKVYIEVLATIKNDKNIYIKTEL